MNAVQNKKMILLFAVAFIASLICGCFMPRTGHTADLAVNEVPSFSSAAYVVIADNKPKFTEDQIVTESYEFYSDLDMLNRCGYAMACIGQDIMPTEER